MARSIWWSCSLNEDFADLFRHREFPERLTLPDPLLEAPDRLGFVLQVKPEHFAGVSSESPTGFGVTTGIFPKGIDLPGNDQGMLEFLSMAILSSSSAMCMYSAPFSTWE